MTSSGLLDGCSGAVGNGMTLDRPVTSQSMSVGCLYNVLFDPREILDLVDTGLPESEAVDRLIGAFYGALQSWAPPETRPTANRTRSRR